MLAKYAPEISHARVDYTVQLTTINHQHGSVFCLRAGKETKILQRLDTHALFKIRILKKAMIMYLNCMGSFYSLQGSLNLSEHYGVGFGGIHFAPLAHGTVEYPWQAKG